MLAYNAGSKWSWKYRNEASLATSKYIGNFGNFLQTCYGLGKQFFMVLFVIATHRKLHKWAHKQSAWCLHSTKCHSKLRCICSIHAVYITKCMNDVQGKENISHDTVWCHFHVFFNSGVHLIVLVIQTLKKKISHRTSRDEINSFSIFVNQDFTL